MSEIKRYKVSFEVDSHPDYSNEWFDSADNWQDQQFLELENDVTFLRVPADAKIEDITPFVPLENGFYTIEGSEYVHERRRDEYSSGVVWMEYNHGDWISSSVISQPSENHLRSKLIYLGHRDD